MLDTQPVTAAAITAAVHDLDLAGRPLCVHSSLRSFGRVEGGAGTIVDGLLAAGCTILVPTFVYTPTLAPPPGRRLPRNGWDYERFTGNDGVDFVFSPDSNEITRGAMGAIPEAILQRSGRVRGNHPVNSFTAVGPQAASLAGDQAADNVYAPLRALAAAGGSIILMGVGLTRLTLLHAAEQDAGRTLFRRFAPGTDGERLEMEVGSCSDGFDAFEPVLSPLARRITVGASRWTVLPAQETLERATVAIVAYPSITHCPNPDCLRCNDAIAGGPII